MRCSLFEIENYCLTDAHRLCPVYQERMRSEQDVPLEVYEARLVLMELQQANASAEAGAQGTSGHGAF